MMIANKQALVQEDGGDFIAGQGVSEGLKSDRGIGVSGKTEVSAKAFRRRFTAEYKLMEAATTLSTDIGIQSACASLSIPRSG